MRYQTSSVAIALQWSFNTDAFQKSLYKIPRLCPIELNKEIKGIKLCCIICDLDYT
jgi:hypothetical protein